MVDAVITAIFGLSPSTNLSLSKRPPPVAAPNTPRAVNASLLGVLWQGELYNVTVGAKGVRWSKQQQQQATASSYEQDEQV